MKIEQLTIEGFGKLHNQKVEFVSDRLNLMVEDNEFGKSTIADAICTTLYGFRARERTTGERLSGIEARRPLDGGPYKLTLELRVERRRYRIIRDFVSDETTVMDLGSNQDVTAEFVVRKGDPQVGEKLTGLSRDQFQQTCFVAHHSLDHQEADTTLKQSLERIASSSKEGKTAAQALEALQNGLDRLPGAITGRKISVETEVTRIDSELSSISVEIGRLENNRRRHDEDAEKLRELQNEIDSKEHEKAGLEDLCFAARAHELGVKISEQERIVEEISLLKRERANLEAFASFQAAMESNLVGWRAQLDAKTRELQRIDGEIAQTKRDLTDKQGQVETRFSEFTSFIPQDAQELTQAKGQLISILSLLAEVQSSRDAELESLRQRQITPARHRELEISLAKLDTATRQGAIGFPNVCEQKQAELARWERTIAQQSGLITEIDAARKTRKRLAVFLLLGSVIAAGLFTFLFFFAGAFQVVWIVGALISLAVLTSSSIAFQRASVFRSDDRSKASIQSETANSAVKGTDASLSELERRWNKTAESVSIGSGRELANACLEYLRLGEDLREFTGLTHELESLERQREDVQERAFSYFQRAGRSLKSSNEVNEQRVTDLCRELDNYLGVRSGIEQAERFLVRELEGRARLASEIQDLSNRLARGFLEADISMEGDDFDDAYIVFRDHVQKHERFKKVAAELLPQLEVRKLSEGEIESWRSERSEASTKLSIRGAGDLKPVRTHAQYAEALNRANSELNSFKDELTEIRLRVTRILDDYAKASEELLQRQAVLEDRQRAITSYRDALFLARERLDAIASDVHHNWSVSLNQIYEEMLASFESGYVSVQFADDLSFTVTTENSPIPFSMLDVKSRLSLGTREQLFLLERLAVSRYLSNAAVKLPLILDDPLVTSDDDRFLKLMRFAIETLPREHQLLIFSCHKQRHEWLREQLSDLFAERVNIARLEPI
ncbi:MAG: AAA family ATPase [Pyrinomonadaceae bacterium]